MKLISYQLLAALILAERFGLKFLSLAKMRNLWPGGYSQALSRLVKSGWVKKERPASLFSLTYQGKNKLLGRFPLLSFLKVNGQTSDVQCLTLVVFNIPESQRQLRDSLRYRLKNLGFGQINRSLYLSPHLSVKETREVFPSLSNINGQGPAPRSLGEGGSIIVFEVPLTSFPEINLSSFWDLGVCSEHYERALAVWETRRDAAGFWGRFLSGIFSDPFLPPSLGSKDWVGTQALEVARTILAE